VGLRKAPLAKIERVVRHFGVSGHHRHPRIFGGDDERAALVAQILDLAFGDLLLLCLVGVDRHILAAASNAWSPRVGAKLRPPLIPYHSRRALQSALA